MTSCTADGSSTPLEGNGEDNNVDAHVHAMSLSNIVGLGGSEVGMEEVVVSMQVWDNNFANNVQVMPYWEDGKGSPKPFEFHPHVEGRFIARREEFHRWANMYVAAVQTKADNRMKELSPPIAPEKPFMRGIFHLKAFKGAVTLPWTWNDKSAGDFCRA